MVGCFLMLENPRTELSRYTILIVDDEELIRNLLVTFLSKVGHLCVTANNGVAALDKMKGNKFDAVITDIIMPEMDGIILTREISNRYPEVPVMVMTAFAEEYSAATAVSVGAREFIRKPFSLSEFVIRLQKMITDSEDLKRAKTEKNEDENIKDLMDELEAALEKRRPIGSK